jgi:5-(carboxyamino)imidazole ribonucleotide mutase
VNSTKSKTTNPQLKGQASAPRVGIIMGSDSDWPTMKLAAEACAEFGVPCETRVVSAHRTPMDMARHGRTAAARGLKVIIAGAGGAAHLPGMVASHTPVPVIGVPVATVAIGNGRNAGLLAVRILAASDAALQRRLLEFMARMGPESRAKSPSLTA